MERDPFHVEHDFNMTHKQPVSRYELLTLVAALLVGVVLRFGMLDRVEIDHFDEGVYSSNVWFADTPDGQYPMRHLYAPPLLPAAIEWCQIFLGTTTLASLLPSLIAGSLTVFLVWFVLRKWYGSDAALIGVWLAAMSDFHIVYCRMALTDVPMGFFLLLAVSVGIEAILRGGLGRILLAGVATGLAWWTKYNGWLPLAIFISGTAAWLVIHRPTKTSKDIGLTLPRIAIRLCLIVVVAVAVWSPVLIGLQDHGGYSAVAANHKGYVQPIADWLVTIDRQTGNHHVLTSWPTMASLIIGLMVGGPLLIRNRRFTWNDGEGSVRSIPRSKACFRLLGWGAFAFVFGLQPTLGVIAIWGLLVSLRRPIDIQQGGSKDDKAVEQTDPFRDHRRTLASWMLLAWMIGLGLATGFYRPYPRLTIPLLIAVWLGAAIAIAWWMRTHRTVENQPVMSRPKTIVLVAAAICIVGASAFLYLAEPEDDTYRRFTYNSSIPAWNSRLDTADAITQITKALGERTGVVFTFSEPALMHVLNSHGLPAAPIASLNVVRPQPNPEFVTFVLIGENARQSNGFEDQWAENSHRFKRVGELSFRPSDVVALNHSESAAQLIVFNRFGDMEEPPPGHALSIYELIQ